MSRRRYLIIAAVVAAVVLSILSHELLTNHQPVILGLEAAPERVRPSGNCQVACNATDSDGDELVYVWSADGGLLNGEGAAVTWTAPIFQGSYNVAVEVTDGHGGETASQTIIEVANDAPTIMSLVPEVDRAIPLATVRVTCNATDPDGDQLTYEWSATGGSITYAGAEAIWVAPDEFGAYNITAVVSDPHGGRDEQWVSLLVSSENPPAIEGLIIRARDHIFLRESTASGRDYDVWKNRVYDIECIASDTSGDVAFEWLCTDGDIFWTSEDGSMIAWIAPDETSVEVKVTVKVYDIVGRSEKALVLYIPSCTCGSWG